LYCIAFSIFVLAKNQSYSITVIPILAVLTQHKVYYQFTVCTLLHVMTTSGWCSG